MCWLVATACLALLLPFDLSSCFPFAPIYVLFESREFAQGPGIVEIGSVGVFFSSFLPWFFSRGFISLFFLCTIWAWLLVGILGFNRLDTILYRCFGFCGWGLGSFSIVKYFKFATTRYFNFAITKCKNWLLYFAKVVFGGVRSSCLDSGLGNLAPL